MKTKEEVLRAHQPFSVDLHDRSEYVVSFDDALDAMEEYTDQVGPKWIRMEEAVPDNDNYVLVFKPNGVSIAGYSKEEGCFIQYWNGKMIEFVGITHWMPLPKKPEQ